MSAVQDTARQRRQGDRSGISGPWPLQCPLFDEPVQLIAYVTGVLGCYLAFVGMEVVLTPITTGDVTLFSAFMCCGALCVEATRRLGQPTGVWRVRRGAVYRRVFSSAALGLAGAFASALFRLFATVAPEGSGAVLLSYPGPNAWLLHPSQASVAAACALVFAVLNTGLIAVAAWLADPDARLADMLWDRERMLLDLTEICVGILVTVACGLSALLLVVALPPVILLQRSLLHSQLKAQARTDPKTGLLNAGAWQGEADLALTRAQRRHESLAVLVLDIDHFKVVNDTHGHLTGDAMLRTLAAEMRQQVRESDLVGRFGGEEFAILLNGTTTTEASVVAERIRRGSSVVRVLTNDALVGVTVSIGVAVLGSHGDDLSELLKAADKALYRAKRTGRDRVCLAEPADAH
jgi:diguanylate cyclase (GGDEF)-like protein